ncbi:MAG: 4'-phosphopantetheinyl transferase superfamily protein [Candidatus Sulfotelmatobacter sp.]|jgi:4'-phosphopantetheinyl transferase
MHIAAPDFALPKALRLADEEVHLWRVDLATVGPAEARWLPLLSADEAKRAARFHFNRDRQRYVAARAWLRLLLGAYLEFEAKELTFSYSAREKPALGFSYAGRRMEFNLSHSGAVALLVFAWGRQVGVDVEAVRADFEVEAIANRFFSAQEREQLWACPPAERHAAFFRCWTRKEAYIKATGAGLSLPLSQFDVSLAAGETNALLATRPDAAEAERWLLREVPAGPGYVASLCVSGGRGWQLRSWCDDGND